jgi:hypothetical protein
MKFMDNLYIGIRGAKQAGKDTLGSSLNIALITSDLVPHIRLALASFSQNLKDAVALVFGFDPVLVHSEDFKKMLTHVHPIELSSTEYETDDDGNIVGVDHYWHSVARWGNKDKFMTGREVLQRFGSDVCRILDSDCWARAPFIEIERDSAIRKAHAERYPDDYPYKPTICIITDMRFPNEVDELRKRDSLIIKIERPGYNGDGHISERALDNFDGDDIIIKNFGTREDLRREATTVAAVISERLQRGD